MKESRLLELLRCTTCGTRLVESFERNRPSLVCAGCGRTTPVRSGIPRFVTTPEDPAGARTQASFGYEWTHFNDWQQSGQTNFNDYFAGTDLQALGSSTVLDAGCGMGRHARQIARHAHRVVAVDFSQAIDQAARNVADLDNVDCVQADLLALPFADDTFDYAYSLGVLHHLTETERALSNLIRKLRPGGRFRIYLYWKRHGWKGQLLKIATVARRVTTRMPFAFLKLLCFVLSCALFAGVVLPYRLLTAVGVKAHEDWPLFVYTRYPFNVLYNDQFDRFSAPIEKRYDPEEVKALLESAGLINVDIRPCYGWIAEGTKAGPSS